MNDELPAWTEEGLRYVDRLTHAGVNIKALKLTAEQYEEGNSYCRNAGFVSFDTLFGYPIRISS